MKKAFYSLLALVFINLSASATYTESTSNGYSSPISDTNLSFEASVSGESVKTSWDTFTKDEDNFIYYKIIRSQKNSSPVYPDDGYIYYTTDINTNSYTDKSPLEGTTYYRVCAITSEKERYCSNVVKIYYSDDGDDSSDSDSQVCIQKTQAAIEKSTGKCKVFSTPCDIPSGWKQVEKCENTSNQDSSSLSSSIKEKLDKLLANFVIKLESKYSENSKRISALEKLIKELEKITKKNIKMKAMVNYLIEKIELKIESYQDDFGNLESIFQNIID
ncbi:fibronectin type III domain-containing protein [Candidatus Gracilibacteria bacterium]|nr:fibronectin type III domain-containing protein [Candidatus Gracilibacteria bacterium]NUJ98356.1 fibronectin type III domain-containing protein [Candidatus Gracilibacteria bacterium]NUJ99289.1 fibronectin type III domain-containing protein [Candidatus Gracilibacteria bacterium]